MKKAELDFDGLQDWAIGKMEKNAKAAGEFVVHDARRRLQAIQDPAFGRAYRRRIVASLLAFNVKRGIGGLEVIVGVQKTNDSAHHGFYIEVGSKTAPAQPFLRPAVIENALKILELLTR